MGYAKLQKQVDSFLWDVTANARDMDSSATSGVIQMFSMPASTVVHRVWAQVITAVTGATATEVGDGNDVDGFIKTFFGQNTGIYPVSAEDAICGAYQQATTAGATDAADVSNSAEEKLYTSADTIDLKLTGTATAGKIRVFVEFTVLA